MMRQISKKRIALCALSIVVFSLNSCEKEEEKSKMNSNKKSAEMTKTSVDIIIAKVTDLNQEEALVGTIVPNQEVSIVSEVAQKVNRIAFTDGTEVTKGQLLYKLNDTDLKAKLKEIQAELKLAKINEQRLSRLLKMEAVRAQEFEDAVAKLQTLEAQEEYLHFQLSKTEIRAPFSGRIGISKVDIGSYVTPGFNLVNLQDQSVVKINFSLPEKNILQIKKGNKIRFTTQISNNQNTATIKASESGLEKTDRNLTVQAIAENPRRELKGGMSAKIYFSVSGSDTKGIKIPSEALIPGENGYNVYLVIKGIAKLSPVTIINRTESEATISSGVNEGDAVVISNILRIGDGMPVNPITSNQH